MTRSQWTDLWRSIRQDPSTFCIDGDCVIDSESGVTRLTSARAAIASDLATAAEFRRYGALNLAKLQVLAARRKALGA